MVESGTLLMCYGGNSIEGSNPSLSVLKDIINCSQWAVTVSRLSLPIFADRGCGKLTIESSNVNRFEYVQEFGLHLDIYEQSC